MSPGDFFSRAKLCDNSRALHTGVAQWQSIGFQIRRLGVRVPPPVYLENGYLENGCFAERLISVLAAIGICGSREFVSGQVVARRDGETGKCIVLERAARGRSL
jgi:hypothetical protein